MTSILPRPEPSMLAALLLAAILACGLGTPLAASAASGPNEPAMVRTQVEILPGDSLGRLARRHSVTVSELRRWNAKKIGKSDTIRAGDTLTIMVPKALAPPEGAGWQGVYNVKSGDTLGRIASKVGVSVAELRAWNKIKKGGVIKVGQHLVYKKRGPRPETASFGRPTKGRLVGGIHLGEGPGYRLRFPKNAYTTPEVKVVLRKCARSVKGQFKGTADILIGDISRPGGGYFPPHHSHQSGRDADVGYYIRNNLQNKTMFRLRAYELDLPKNWALLRCFLEEGEVVRVFMDTAMQRRLAKWLVEDKGVAPETIDSLFEAYGAIKKRALVRHAPSHDTHLHVRFACAAGDTDCREDRHDKVKVFTL